MSLFDGAGVGSSVMRFVRLLIDGEQGGDDYTMVSSTKTKFTWAIIGENYKLLAHLAYYGVVDLVLEEPCKLLSNDDEDSSILSDDKNMAHYCKSITAHGITATSAVGFIMLFIAAISASTLHKYLGFKLGGRKAWMQLHLALNSTIRFLLLTAAVAVLLVRWQK